MSEELIQNITSQELSPLKRVKWEALIAQRNEIFDRYNATTLKECIAVEPEKEDLAALLNIYQKLRHIIDTKDKKELTTAERAKEIFKDGFFGPDQIEKAFTLSTGEKLITLGEEIHEVIMKKMKEKFEEPDVRVFMENIAAGLIDSKDFMLILRVPELSDGKPINIHSLRECIAQDMRRQRKGEFLPVYDDWKHHRFILQKVTETTLPEWVIVSRSFVPLSEDKTQRQQGELMGRYAESLGIDPEQAQSRFAVDVIYDYIVQLRGGNGRVSPGRSRFERTRSVSDDAMTICLGQVMSQNLSIIDISYNEGHDQVGVVLCR